jgi:hypothetical protein
LCLGRGGLDRGVGLSATFTFLVAGRRTGAFLLRLLVDLRLRFRLCFGYVLALFADDGDRPADRHLTLLHRDLEEHAGGVGLDLLRHLLRVDLVQRLALLDPVAFLLEPPDDGSGLHSLAEPGQLDLSCHFVRRLSGRP